MTQRLRDILLLIGAVVTAVISGAVLRRFLEPALGVHARLRGAVRRCAGVKLRWPTHTIMRDIFLALSRSRLHHRRSRRLAADGLVRLYACGGLSRRSSAWDLSIAWFILPWARAGDDGRAGHDMIVR